MSSTNSVEVLYTVHPTPEESSVLLTSETLGSQDTPESTTTSDPGSTGSTVNYGSPTPLIDLVTPDVAAPAPSPINLVTESPVNFAVPPVPTPVPNARLVRRARNHHLNGGFGY